MKRLVLFCAITGLLVGLTGWAQPASAINGECGDSSGPAGADVPCHCGDTVATDTVLKASDPVVRTVCSTTFALRVASNVALDASSARLRCASGTRGIEAIASGASIEGGIIDGCALGIFVRGDGNTIERVFVRNSDGVGLAVFGNGNVLVRNLCHNNGSTGIFIDGEFNMLDRNYCRGNGGDGIAVQGPSNDFIHNRAHNNVIHGIFAPDLTNTTDFRNYATGNAGVAQCHIGESTGKYC